jgi:hypothetical protein
MRASLRSTRATMNTFDAHFNALRAALIDLNQAHAYWRAVPVSVDLSQAIAAASL